MFLINTPCREQTTMGTWELLALTPFVFTGLRKKATNNEGEVIPYDSGHYDIDKSHGKA